MTREESARYLFTHPATLGKYLGYKDLTELHERWMLDMLGKSEDQPLQAHRGSYKTTYLCIVIALLLAQQREKNIIFLRKTDADVSEVIRNVKRILLSDVFQQSYRAITKAPLMLVKDSVAEITTSAYTAPRGAPQLLGIGINGSITGKHADILITDDIVNLKDRKSRADRETTKAVYMELQNIKNRGGRIINTGTPWHPEDAFTLMPNIRRYDCYSTGLIDKQTLAALRDSMTASLFAANYELKHIADEDVIFGNPQINGEPYLVEQGICHVDAAYGGEDGTAFTICKKKDGKYYIFGKLWHKHVDDCEADIIALRQRFNAGIIYCEDNGDKGYLAKELRSKGERVTRYHENTNKFIKITSYLKAVWKDVIFVAGTDQEYIDQICDYNENAEHDDAPDSAASIVRVLWNRRDNSDYKSILR